jgi:hypothetical protein
VSSSPLLPPLLGVFSHPLLPPFEGVFLLPLPPFPLVVVEVEVEDSSNYNNIINRSVNK